MPVGFDGGKWQRPGTATNASGDSRLSYLESGGDAVGGRSVATILADFPIAVTSAYIHRSSFGSIRRCVRDRFGRPGEFSKPRLPFRFQVPMLEFVRRMRVKQFLLGNCGAEPRILSYSPPSKRYRHAFVRN